MGWGESGYERRGIQEATTEMGRIRRIRGSAPRRQDEARASNQEMDKKRIKGKIRK